MKKAFLFLAIILGIVQVSYSQEENKQFIRKGLIRSTATISPGIMLKENVSTISLHGTLEYYVADNVSLRGDSYYSLQIDEPDWETLTFENTFPFLSYNHATFSGASYHFKTTNNFDPYVCIEPGIAISQSVIGMLSTDGYYYSKRSVNPMISSTIGFNFYFQRFFHLFGEARYISGKHLSDAPTPISLSELRFSFGLGFNLNLLKKK